MNKSEDAIVLTIEETKPDVLKSKKEKKERTPEEIQLAKDKMAAVRMHKKKKDVEPLSDMIPI